MSKAKETPDEQEPQSEEVQTGEETQQPEYGVVPGLPPKHATSQETQQTHSLLETLHRDMMQLREEMFRLKDQVRKSFKPDEAE